MKSADLYFFCGQGDAATSPGIIAMGNQWRGSGARVRTYYWWSWENALRDMNERAGLDALRLAIGYSMGANALTWIAGGVGNYPGTIAVLDWACFIDPTFLSNLTPLGANVREALHYHSNSLDLVGHGTIIAGADTKLQVVETYLPHLMLDIDQAIQARITAEITRRLKAT